MYFSKKSRRLCQSAGCLPGLALHNNDPIMEFSKSDFIQDTMTIHDLRFPSSPGMCH
ncbi:uncharacterized protein Dmul_05100 [Desulfococcus multivorans]|nr:uncharacterized protein Dmul_05100 [Desulfococcus multivorans]